MRKPFPQSELAADHREFLSAWRKVKWKKAGGWVPVRLLPITGIIAYELARARLIDFDGERARPRKTQAKPGVNSVKGTFGGASGVRQVDVEEYLRGSQYDRSCRTR